ncbi:HNH endonuclease signature motif containing protein [Aeromicrobium piscarium]|uniref:HNH nuclease domain-containing protein n=1 Tax=Aeromicrobium piscarium TaxID=2590901 RepID=A0A554SP65_9ACTN|nr:hypothetical protein FNM00_00490 [Aeromicrobium piscarium]
MTCSAAGCDRKAYCRGLCDPHYRQALRNNELARVVRTVAPCAVDGCDKPSRRRGWCETHARRWYEHGHVEDTRRPPTFGETALEVFEKQVDRTETCWQWTGNVTGRYGRLSFKGADTQAHRWSYEHFVGPIPDGLEIDHTCENTRCVNPGHLEPVTGRENVRRYHERKRARA